MATAVGNIAVGVANWQLLAAMTLQKTSSKQVLTSSTRSPLQQVTKPIKPSSQRQVLTTMG